MQGPLGYTHCSIEDIGVLRSLPNIIILSPCDSLEVAKSVFAAAKTNAPVYIRITGDNQTEIVNDKYYNFQIGKAIKIMELMFQKQFVVLFTNYIKTTFFKS